MKITIAIPNRFTKTHMVIAMTAITLENSHRFFYGDCIPMPDLLTYPIKVTSFETKLAISYEKGKHLHLAEKCFIDEALEYYRRDSRLNI